MKPEGQVTVARMFLATALMIGGAVGFAVAGKTRENQAASPPSTDISTQQSSTLAPRGSLGGAFSNLSTLNTDAPVMVVRTHKHTPTV